MKKIQTVYLRMKNGKTYVIERKDERVGDELENFIKTIELSFRDDRGGYLTIPCGYMMKTVRLCNIDEVDVSED